MRRADAGVVQRALAEKCDVPLQNAPAAVLIDPLTLPPEKRPLIVCTIAGAPGPALKRSLTIALKEPDPEIEAPRVDCTCSFCVVLQ